MSSRVIIQDSVNNNGRKKMLLMGITGSGKSSLCNVLTGNLYNTGPFAVGHDPSSCTRETKFGEAFFCGNKTRPFTIVDTIGFSDPDLENDQEIIVELVGTLQKFCDHINAIMIVINGGNPRLDAALIAMIKIFEGIFTTDMWKHVGIIFTHLSMDEKSVKKREKSSCKTDQQFGEDMIKKINNKFPNSKGLLKEFFMIDATYDESDGKEADPFENSTNRLYELLERNPGLPTTKVMEVETESKRLNRLLEEDKAKTIEMERKLEAYQKMSEEEKEEMKKNFAKQNAADKVKMEKLMKSIDENYRRNEKEKAEIKKEFEKQSAAYQVQMENLKKDMDEKNKNSEKEKAEIIKQLQEKHDQAKAQMEKRLADVEDKHRRDNERKKSSFTEVLDVITDFIPLVSGIKNLFKKNVYH